MFLYGKESINTQFLYQAVNVIQELNIKKRKILSLRGFFLYALEIMEAGKDLEVLTTNLQPFFWRKVKNIIRQNKKGALLEFLFGSQNNPSLRPTVPADQTKEFKGLEEKIQALQNEVDFFKQKLIDLETNVVSQTLAKEENLNMLSEASSNPEQGDQIRSSRNPELEKEPDILSKALKRTDKASSKNIPLEQNQAQNAEGLHPPSERSEQANFRTLGNISEEEKIEIIQTGFRLNQEGKISLKKYYKGMNEMKSLSQLRGYRIKYESIRRTKLYQKLKE